MKKIALLFPGQGSQYIGMARTLCKGFIVADKTFQEASEQLGFDLKKLCNEGIVEDLTRTENAQPAILTASVAAYRVFMQEFEVLPLYMAGHSLGEITALTCSGAIRFSDAVKIVRQRGKFMQEAVAVGVGAMVAVSGMDKEIIEQQCLLNSHDEGIAVISNYNSNEQIVISGHKTYVDKVAVILSEKGARCVPLKVSAPFHSPLMQAAADRLNEELKKYSYQEPKWPVISNLNALPYQGMDSIIENLTEQVVRPVQWQQSMRYLKENEVEICIELGPGTVLKNLMKKNVADIKVYSYDKAEDIEELKKQISIGNKGNSFNHTVLTKCLAVAVCTQNRNWNNEEYQKGVVEPYKKIQMIQDELEREGKKPTVEQMKEALDMLKSVFATKKVPIHEQKERFSEVFDVTGTGHIFNDYEIL